MKDGMPWPDRQECPPTDELHEPVRAFREIGVDPRFLTAGGSLISNQHQVRSRATTAPILGASARASRRSMRSTRIEAHIKSDERWADFIDGTVRESNVVPIRKTAAV